MSISLNVELIKVADKEIFACCGIVRVRMRIYELLTIYSKGNRISGCCRICRWGKVGYNITYVYNVGCFRGRGGAKEVNQ